MDGSNTELDRERGLEDLLTRLSEVTDRLEEERQRLCGLRSSRVAPPSRAFVSEKRERVDRLSEQAQQLRRQIVGHPGWGAEAETGWSRA